MTTRKFNDFLDDIKPWEEYIPKDWLKIIKEKKATHAGDELKTQRQMASLLEKIRSGMTEESEMEELIDKFDLENPCSELLMDKFLKENQHVKTKIETLKKISPDQSLLLTQIESVENIILDFYDNDVYLLHICEQWSKKNKRNMLKQVRFFSQLKTNDPSGIFRVIDHDLHPNLDEKPDDCVIYHATQGSIQSYNFWKDSLSKFSIDKKIFPLRCRYILETNFVAFKREKGIIIVLRNIKRYTVGNLHGAHGHDLFSVKIAFFS